MGFRGEPEAGGVPCGAVDGGSAGRAGGEGVAVVAPSGCPDRGAVLCGVGDAGFGRVTLAC
jgi:hypothetical protein